MAFAGLSFAVLGATAFDEGHPLVLPGIAVACVGLAAYLLMLGLIAEVAAERWIRANDPTFRSYRDR
jgi:hypothetical protein